MANFYTETRNKENDNLEPKQSTIDFILNYSKALNVLESKDENYEIFLN